LAVPEQGIERRKKMSIKFETAGSLNNLKRSNFVKIVTL
jgi:hypothetical protein